MYEHLIQNKYDRKDYLIALGGGVVGDLCGFTAATYLRGKNKLCNYLVDNTTEEAIRCGGNSAWTRVIWDVTAVGWLLDENELFMQDYLIHSPIPEYDLYYSYDDRRHFMKYVYHVDRH